MQKFVVSPSIGGASITWAAVKYLARLIGGDNDDTPLDLAFEIKDEELGEAHGTIGNLDKDIFSPLLTVWWSFYKEYHKDAEFAQLNEDDSVYLGCYYSGDLRKKLLPFIEVLGGDYRMLDSLNDGCELRVIEVPDGYQCGVTGDPETGCEVVEEYPRIWVTMKDDEYRFLRTVRDVCDKISKERAWEGKEGPVVAYDWTDAMGFHTKVAVDGVYGVAKCMKDGNVSYLYLKKNTYYTATDDHGKECYEIVGDKENKFRFNVVFHEGDEVRAYFSLIKALEI